MLEDYRVLYNVGRSAPTGRYELTRKGTRRMITRYQQYYKTPLGEMLPEAWREKVREEIKNQGEQELFERMKDHCRKYCAWIGKETEVEDYAMECTCSRAYLHWEDFMEDNTVIWM